MINDFPTFNLSIVLINLGLFRKEINKQHIARFYYSGISSIKDVEIFNPDVFSIKEVQTNYLEYHLRGICTEKGIEKLNQFITMTS